MSKKIINFDYYYGKQEQQYEDVKIPKALIHEKPFSQISSGAKLMYGFIMERMEISVPDENGKVYVIYPEEEIMKDMNYNKVEVSKYMSELEGVKLLERVPSEQEGSIRLYLKKFY